MNLVPNCQITYYHNSDEHNLLTDLSPSWGAANCAATQELPSILWNPKVQYHVHKCPPLVPILIHINPIHTIPLYLSEIHFNIVFTVVSFLLAFPLISYMHSSFPPHSC
jgi:hypothetical protein